eukprot:10006467-Prorocentrum_lima.AAC.1
MEPATEGMATEPFRVPTPLRASVYVPSHATNKVHLAAYTPYGSEGPNDPTPGQPVVQGCQGGPAHHQMGCKAGCVIPPPQQLE